MRKHSPRKWLHAILDLLPVILIPVFMVYSHRHTLTERTVVDIQYKYQSNEVDTFDDLIVGNIYFINELPIIAYGDSYSFEINILKYNEYQLVGDDINVFDVPDFNTYDCNFNNYINVFVDDTSVRYRLTNGDTYSQSFNEDGTYGGYFFDVVFQVIDVGELEDTIYDYAQNPGVPTYTDFNVIESVEVLDSNDNIMSVFAKDLSNTVDNYFNMNEVFNLGDVWTWINTNIFSGTAPLIAKTIWNIIVYEFVIDLLFVFYSFFMFLIDFVDNLLEKPFNKGR